MDTEERIQCRREQYRLRKDMETPERQREEGVEIKNVCDIEGLLYQWSRGDL